MKDSDSDKILQSAVEAHKKQDYRKAKEYYVQYLNTEAANPIALSNLALLLRKENDIANSEELLRRCIRLFPRFWNAYINYANLLLSLDRREEAKAQAVSLLSQNPRDSIVLTCLSGILKGLGLHKESIRAIDLAIKFNPDNPSPYGNYVGLLLDEGRLDEAKALLDKALSLKQQSAELLINAAIFYRDTNCLVSAKEAIGKAIDLTGTNETAFVVRASILQSEGNLIEAEQALAKALEINSFCASAHFLLSLQNGHFKNATLLDCLLSESATKGVSPIDESHIYFARSNYWHKSGDFAKSQECLEKANQIKHEVLGSNIDQILSRDANYNNAIKAFAHTQEETSPINELKHIFIVGLPRCGSTLLERILTLHPNTAGLGEARCLEFAVNQLISRKLKAKGLEILYKEYSGGTALGHSHITIDKNLYNICFSKVIATQMPSSRLIYLHRNIFDNLISLYRANMSGANRWSHSLAHATKYAIHQAIYMNEIRRLYPEKVIFLSYESLTQSSEHTLKKLINRLGWEWNDMFLHPERSEYTANTRSAVQVKNAIHGNSNCTWKNYKRLLRQPALLLDTQLNGKVDPTFYTALTAGIKEILV